MRVTILICTRQRFAELRRCCESLRTLKFRRTDAPELDVVIVDNTPGGTPGLDESVATRWSGLATRVVVEERTGIPFARNRALDERHRGADFVAFIDDDETVVPSWLENLLTVADTSGADLVAGPALPRFPDATPPGVRAVIVHHAERRRAETGAAQGAAGTGNLLIRTSALARHPDVRFDESFGFCGGEDTDWTRRLAGRGASIVWADRAIVWHWLSDDRADTAWIDRRAYAAGHRQAQADRSTLDKRGLASRGATVVRRISRALFRFGAAALRRDADATIAWRNDLALSFGWCCGMARMNHPETYVAVTAERAPLRSVLVDGSGVSGP